MAVPPMIRLKRIYAPASPDDGLRVLVDRVWPRGVSRARAAIDLWAKDVAPSTPLRQWFGHQPARWPAFRDRYLAELAANPAAPALAAQLAGQRVTLLYGARDGVPNHAQVLQQYLADCHAAAQPPCCDTAPADTPPAPSPHA